MPNPIPNGMEGLIPHLVVNDCAGALEFYSKALGAQEVFRAEVPGSTKIMHASMLIGGRPLFLADDFPEMCGGKERTPGALGGTSVTIHQYVEDTDAAVAQAERAGATVTMPPEDMFWGARYATVLDPYGHSWAFSTHIKDVSPEEMQAAMAAFGG